MLADASSSGERFVLMLRDGLGGAEVANVSSEDHAIVNRAYVDDALQELNLFMQRVTEGTGAVEITEGFSTESIGGGGGVFIERRGPVVIFSIAAVDFGSSSQTHSAAIPYGFRPPTFIYELMSIDGGDQNGQVDVLASGSVRTPGISGRFRGTMVWSTADDWPDL